MLDEQWRKSTRSHTSGCVEIALDYRPTSLHNPHVLVRNSQSPNDAMLTFTAQEWQAFLDGVRLREFDLPLPKAVMP